MLTRHLSDSGESFWPSFEGNGYFLARSPILTVANLLLPIFSFCFYFSYVDGSPSIGTDYLAEAHISNSGLPKRWKALFEHPTDHAL